MVRGSDSFPKRLARLPACPAFAIAIPFATGAPKSKKPPTGNPTAPLFLYTHPRRQPTHQTEPNQTRPDQTDHAHTACPSVSLSLSSFQFRPKSIQFGPVVCLLHSSVCQSPLFCLCCCFAATTNCCCHYCHLLATCYYYRYQYNTCTLFLSQFFFEWKETRPRRQRGKNPVLYFSLLFRHRLYLQLALPYRISSIRTAAFPPTPLLPSSTPPPK